MKCQTVLYSAQWSSNIHVTRSKTHFNDNTESNFERCEDHPEMSSLSRSKCLVLTRIDEQDHTHTHTSWEQSSVELFDNTVGQTILSERPISCIPGATHWSWPTLTFTPTPPPLSLPDSPLLHHPTPPLPFTPLSLRKPNLDRWPGHSFSVTLRTHHSETHPSIC